MISKKKLSYLSIEINIYIEKLKDFKTHDNFSNLNKLVLTNLIVFNRRREGEVSRVKLETYTEKPDYDNLETDIHQQTLSPIEKHLCKSYSYMSTIGKKYRRVPIVYPALIDEALKSLVENRHFCGILPDNPFLFPNSVCNHIRGCDVLRELVEKCELKHTLHKPSLIKSTLLRKHVATIAQILVLNGDDLGDLSNHLGHSEEVHKTFYRQQESVIEKTKITKMLELINTGTVAKYKGKSLVDVTLEDVINAATDHVNREEPDVDDDEDDPNSDVNDNQEDNNPVPSEQISLPSMSKCNPSYPKNNTNSKQKRLF